MDVTVSAEFITVTERWETDTAFIHVTIQPIAELVTDVLKQSVPVCLIVL